MSRGYCRRLERSIGINNAARARMEEGGGEATSSPVPDIGDSGVETETYSEQGSQLPGEKGTQDE